MEHFTLNLELMVEIIIRKFYLVWKCIFFHENVLLDILSLWALCASVVFFAKHLGKSFLAVWCI